MVAVGAVAAVAAAALLLAACGDDGGGGGGGADAAAGKQVFESACVDCHSVTGDTKLGPPLNGIYGTQVQLENGETVEVDDAYLQQSIRDPGSQVVPGFTTSMPKMGLSDDQVDALVAYIRSL